MKLSEKIEIDESNSLYAILNDARRTVFRESFYEFFKYFWDVVSTEELIDNWHIKYLCDELQEVFRKWYAQEQQPDLIINIPPGSSKSTIVSVMFPVWVWTMSKKIKFITGSHAANLATSLSVKSRDIITSDKFSDIYPDIKLKGDENNKTSYQLFGKGAGGSRTITSAGSAIIGQHAHFIIIDDPTSASPSKTELETANNWIISDLATRKIDKELTVTILIQQRVHENDASATLIKDGARVICLPAVDSDNVNPVELRQEYVDGLLDPRRMNHKILDSMRKKLGSYAYAAQFLQSPSAEGDEIIKKDWCKRISVDDELRTRLNKVITTIYSDTAYTEKTNNDPSAIAVTKKLDGIMYVLHTEDKRLEFPELLKWIENTTTKFGSNRVVVEPKASGKSVVQSLKNKLNILESKAPTDSKETRLRAVSPVFESGRVVFVQNWFGYTEHDKAIYQLTKLKAENDDIRDCIVMGCEELNSKNANYSIRIL